MNRIGSMLLAATALLAACGSPEAGASRRDASAAPSPAAFDAAPARPAVAPAVPQMTPGAVTQAPDTSAPPVATPPADAPSEPAPARAAPAAGAAETATSILQGAERAFASVRSMRADFVQDLTVPLLDQTQRSRGKLYNRRPDRLLMRFTSPAGDVVVADGRYLWMYYPSSDPKQVIRTSAGAGQAVDFQRQFLTDPTSRFDARLDGTEAVGGRPAHVLTLTPKGEAGYGAVRIWVDQRDSLVRRFEITEQNGSVRRIELSGLERNVELPDSLFRFTPPAGAQVFDQ